MSRMPARFMVALAAQGLQAGTRGRNGITASGKKEVPGAGGVEIVIRNLITPEVQVLILLGLKAAYEDMCLRQA